MNTLLAPGRLALACQHNLLVMLLKVLFIFIDSVSPMLAKEITIVQVVMENVERESPLCKSRELTAENSAPVALRSC